MRCAAAPEVRATQMLGKIYLYFGFLGVASIAAWAAALATVVVSFFASGRRRVLGHSLALATAALALVLAWENSDSVSQIEKEYVNPLELMGVKPVEEEKAPEADYEYRKLGKRERRSEAQSGERTTSLTHVSAAGPEAPPGPRTLPEQEFEEANRYDAANLYAAGAVFWVALLAAAWTYWQALQLHFAGGGSLGAWLPRKRTACVCGANPHLVRQLAERLARAGESVIFLGPWDPKPVLTRPHMEGSELRFREVKLTRCASLEEFRAHPLLLDSLWFGYCCAVIADQAASQEALGALKEFLESRRKAGLAAAQTVNVIWWAQQPLARETLAAWSALCRATNSRLIVTAPQTEPSGIAGWVEETFVPESVGSTAPNAARPAQDGAA